MPSSTKDTPRRGLRQAQIPPALVRAIANERCVLFAGAGFSLPVTGLTWGGLMARLKAGLPGIDSSDWENLSPLDQAQLFVDERGRQALEDLLKDVIPDQREIWDLLKPGDNPALLLRESLVGLPFPYIFTTNYDALIELLLTRSRTPHTVLVDDDQVLVSYSPRLRRVVKVHGDLELSDTIILSQEDYLNYKRLRPGMYKLWQSQLISYTFLFFGFGLTDPNFRLLYNDLKRLLPTHQKTFRAFAFMTQENETTLDHWRKRGLYIIQSRDFKAQDKKVGMLGDRVRQHLRDRQSLPHLLNTLGPTYPGGENPQDTLSQALRPLKAQLKTHAEALWEELDAPPELRQGVSALASWPGRVLVDVPPRDKNLEKRAQTLFHTLRRLRTIDPELGDFQGDGPLGPPTAALLGALLYRGRHWEDAIEALEEARYWYEDEIGGTPWWIARMLGRAARRARDYPSAWEFLYFCVETYGPQVPGEHLAVASDASLLMELTQGRLSRMKLRNRLEMGRQVSRGVLNAIKPILGWLEGPIPADLYGRRTMGYGNWHLGELHLEDGFLRAQAPNITLEAAMPLLTRGVTILPEGESRRLRARMRERLKTPFWGAVGGPLKDLL